MEYAAFLQLRVSKPEGRLHCTQTVVLFVDHNSPFADFSFSSIPYTFEHLELLYIDDTNTWRHLTDNGTCKYLHNGLWLCFCCPCIGDLSVATERMRCSHLQTGFVLLCGRR